MKNKIVYIFSILLILVSCDDVLDKHNLNTVDDAIWDDYSSATVYLNDVYSRNMPAISLAANSGFSDEGYSSNEAITNILYGVVDETNVNAINDFNVGNFELIRRINVALEGIERGALSQDEKEQLAGQALFFRAWRNWELVKLYGGIPIILNAQDPFYDDLNIPRSTTKASVEFIVADLDRAIDGLPASWELSEDNGRVTSGAAAAFKGRVLLAFASPMFNANNNRDRWQKAYDANLQAKQILDEAGYGLHPVFEKMFTDDPMGNPEAVFYRNYMENSDYSNGWEASIRPPSGGGNMSNGPTWNLVQAFPMANGLPIFNEESGYDEIRYWENRDPRFYATVGYNGGVWEMAGRSEDFIWTLERYPGEQNRTPGTGFYLKKASNPSIDINNTSNGGTAWLEIRYAEVIMNLAECALEIGNMAEAIELVGLVRARAGIESANNYGLGNTINIETIIRERQIEFAFENKRYWDLRRRRMFTDDLGPNTPKLNGTKRKGLTIQGQGLWNRMRITEGEYAGWRRIDTAVHFGYVDINRPGDYEEYFNVFVKDMDNFQISGENAIINYPEICYFFGIQQSVINRSPAVEQTLGWIYGTFDPLAE